MTKRILNNNFISLEEMDWVTEKCVRCNMCKFPPLARVESKAYSIGCPSFDYFKFHSNSGGGKMIMSSSLMQGRSKITEAVCKTVYGCTLCGSCDVSCKYNADIELLETLLMLRNKVFLEGKTDDAHNAILEHIKVSGYPLTGLKNAAVQVPASMHTPGAETLLWAGPHFSYDAAFKDWMQKMLKLLELGGIRFQLLLDKEPYIGRAALEIGDRELFHEQSVKVADAIKRSGAKKIICLSAEDYSTLRSQTPKYVDINVPSYHVTEIYEKMLKKRSFKGKPVNRNSIGWHDPTYLGRLGGKFIFWEGTNEKEGRGIRAYIPERRIDYGTNGVFEAPRKVLLKITGKPALEFSLKREYTYSAGETGQAQTIMPAFVLATSKKRVQEAIDCGIETIVTECPQAYQSLRDAAKAYPNVDVVSLTELLAQSCL
ncbi:MAG: (Fe-S)-binding protein [Deltaproteobacteria bacterium]|nr:(Fe-S)-binding protein [Deltaproteobacteria bacterium]